MGQPLWKSLEVPQTVKQSYHMTQQPRSYVPMRNENMSTQKISSTTQMAVATLFIIAKK